MDRILPALCCFLQEPCSVLLLLCDLQELRDLKAYRIIIGTEEWHGGRIAESVAGNRSILILHILGGIVAVYARRAGYIHQRSLVVRIGIRPSVFWCRGRGRFRKEMKLIINTSFGLKVKDKLCTCRIARDINSLLVKYRTRVFHKLRKCKVGGTR